MASKVYEIARAGGVGSHPEFASIEMKHCLTRFEISVKAEDAGTQAAWGKIKSIEFKKADTGVFDDMWVCYNDENGEGNSTPSTNTPTVWPSYQITKSAGNTVYTDTKFAAADFAGAVALTTTATPICYTMMAPFTVTEATNEIVMEITTLDKDGGTDVVTKVDLDIDHTAVPFAGGTQFTVNLTFNAKEIKATATITPWKSTGTGSADVGVLPLPAVGDYYFTDGTTSPKLESGKTANGVIYWVDDTDPTKFKVVALTDSKAESVAANQNPLWAASNSYVIGAGAQSDADGKANVAAIKSAFDNRIAGIAITESNFEAAFPAAAYCYNYKGKDGNDPVGTWHLPAKTELQYLWCAFNGKAPISWASSTNSAAPADVTAQKMFNGYLTAAGGSNITSSLFWSSTEHNRNTFYAWYVGFSNGSTDFNVKGSSNYVRCVREITPPAIGDLRDGGIVYEVNGANYKVFSLDQGANLTWAAKNTYLVGPDGQNETDGKANVAAMKAYSRDNTNNGDATKKTSGAFATDFPAAEFCDRKNTGGVTGWYLPAKEELVALYTVYNTNKDVLDKAITANQGAAMDSNFWSSTEFSYYTYDAWYVAFSNGITNSRDKGLSRYVRCVREN